MTTPTPTPDPAPGVEIEITNPVAFDTSVQAVIAAGKSIADEAPSIEAVAREARAAGAAASGPADCAGVIESFRHLMEAVATRLEAVAGDVKRGGEAITAVASHLQTVRSDLTDIDGNAANGIQHRGAGQPTDRPAGG